MWQSDVKGVLENDDNPHRDIQYNELGQQVHHLILCLDVDTSLCPMLRQGKKNVQGN